MHADILECIQSTSFTRDAWTSRASRHYISLACHYPASGFKMRAYALANQLLTESHTTSDIPEHSQTTVDDRDLPPQEVPIYVATDNVQNFFVRLAFYIIPVQCAGHALQLTLEDAKKESAEVLTVLK